METSIKSQFEHSESPVIVVERVFDAPRALVWKAWTDPRLVTRWWGPADFTMPSAKIDLRVGGKYLFNIHTTDGQDFWVTGTYLEIEHPNKIVETDSFGDEQGRVVPAATYGMEGNYPLEWLITLIFEELAPGRTKFTLKHEGFPEAEQIEPGRAFWEESFDKLEKVLEEIR